MADENGGGGFLEQLPEELRAEPSLKDYKDVAGLARSLVETKKMVGASIRPPGPDATPEQRQEFAAKLAEKVPGVRYLPPEELARFDVPKDPAEYTFDGVEIPDGIQADPEKVRVLAKEMGWTKEHAKKYLQAHVNERVAAAEKLQEAEKALRKELGLAYDDRVTAARTAAIQAGVPEADAKALTPDQLRVWINVAKAVGTDGRPVADQGKGGSSRMPPAEAEAAAAEIRLNPAYWDQGHPQHRYLVKRHTELMGMAYPS